MRLIESESMYEVFACFAMFADECYPHASRRQRFHRQIFIIPTNSLILHNSLVKLRQYVMIQYVTVLKEFGDRMCEGFSIIEASMIVEDDPHDEGPQVES